MTGTIQE